MPARKKAKNPTPGSRSAAGATTHRKSKGRVPAERESSERSAEFPVVGIGASAGGLAAFETFFTNMPADSHPGMAFVLIQHLAPDRKSILADLIKRYTLMQVFEVEDGMAVQPNCIYIIPPNRDMALLHGKLQLLEPMAPRGRRLPIDFFFRSLAHDQHERAICIVLSGTGCDGTQGVRTIKAEGGMVMVQDPESTEYHGMPRSAIATGLVDYELLPAEMPAQLLAYVAHMFDQRLRPALNQVAWNENTLKNIFILLQVQTGHDFSQYKPNTILRRIERRLAIHQAETIDNYLKILQQEPAEVEALFRDLLIGVTGFFRDPGAFQLLQEQVIPKLFADKPAGGVVRVWSVGCATGEEAYSLAILLQEYLATQVHNYQVQIFATDIDSQAIATARAGLYPASIAADMSAERLATFFSVEADGSSYRVHKAIRDMLVFSEQSVIKDPPFSRVDLISCRNLLIYLGAELQKKLVSLFHYALNPGGVLFLGVAETVGEAVDLFAIVDRNMKLYSRKEDIHGLRHLVPGRFLSPMTTVAQFQQTGTAGLPGKMSLRALTEQALLQQIGPTGALVNDHGDILYLHGRSGMYLEPALGETGVNNILKMARTGLRDELSTALRQAAEAKELVRRTGLLVKTNDEFLPVNLTIRPLAARPDPGRRSVETDPAIPLAPPLFLIILEESLLVHADQAGPEAVRDAETEPDAPSASPAQEADTRIALLKQELWAKEMHIQSANEELKITNEELQSVNEELQSTNEELETSKEELQSINEELVTINTELQTKVSDLTRANNDMNNLLAGTGIATVFVDHDLQILRFTSVVTGIINLIASDLGRPVSHIVSNLVGYDRLAEDVLAVLDTLVPKEMEVETVEGTWYILRIHPYRTLDNVIDGAVITFVDITEAKKARVALSKANELFRLGVVLRDASDAITVQGLDGRILAWNPGAERMYGWSEAEALAMNVRELMPEELHNDAQVKVRQLSQAKILKPYRTQRISKNGMVMEVSMTSTALINKSGQVYAIATTERGERSKNSQVSRGSS